MPKTVQEWHQRYENQTRWTRALAHYLYQRFNLPASPSVLEVGCGTGAAIQQLSPCNARLFGIDINFPYLTHAATLLPEATLIQADALQLPIRDDVFDVCFCHYFLLWLSDPSKAIGEMLRVTRPGGVVIALAEPDYGNRIDFPDELSVIGRWQLDSLSRQGANPLLGRQLRALFSRSGLENVETGVLGGEWRSKIDLAEFHSEWDTIQADLIDDPQKYSQLPHLSEIDSKAQELGERILFVPTFYAWGFVPYTRV